MKGNKKSSSGTHGPVLAAWESAESQGSAAPVGAG